MKNLLTIFCLLGCVSLFILPPSVLEMVGWSYLSAGASAITKIHPAFYILIPAAFFGIASGARGVRSIVSMPSFLLYALAAIILVLKGALIAASGVTGGELSVAIVNFFIPVLIMLSLPALNDKHQAMSASALHWYFIVSSLLALVEQVLGHRVIPSFLDFFPNEHRSAALWGHPLVGSLFTGIYLVYIVASEKKGGSQFWRIAEILLHALAMFAYGGRSALVFTAITIALSGFFARSRGNQGSAAMQRLLPLILIFVGVVLVFLPIPIVDATLERFTNDGGSADSRNAAFAMLGYLNTDELMFGITGPRRLALQAMLHTEAGIEVSWVALTLSYGLLAVIPLLIGLPLLLIRLSTKLDRSAFYMAFMFLIVTAGSQGFGGKAAIIAQVLVMLLLLGRPTPIVAQRRATPESRSSLFGLRDASS